MTAPSIRRGHSSGNRLSLVLSVAMGLAGVTLGHPLCAQPIDSVGVARTAYREALSAPTREAARELLLRATRAWPTQSAYWAPLARVAGRLNDTATVTSAVRALIDMQLAEPLLADSTLDRWWSIPTLAPLHREAQRLAGPLANAHVIATLADSTIFAEGVDAHSRTDALYVASIRHRTVFEHRPDGTVRDLLLHQDPRMGAVFGVRVAPDGRALWVTTAPHAAATPAPPLPATAQITGRGALVKVRIRDGHIEGYWPLSPDTASHIPGDLAVAPDGTVIVTDSDAATVYVLDPRARRLRAIVDPWFRSLQGVVAVPSRVPGKPAALVADYSHGLLHVELAPVVMGPRVRRLQEAPGTTVLGIDGMVWHDGALLAVQNGVTPARIVRVQLDAELTRVQSLAVIDKQPAIATDPTIGTLWRGGFAYVANSQWSQYNARGQRVTGTALSPTVILCVPLPSGAATKGTRSSASTPPVNASCTRSVARSP